MIPFLMRLPFPLMVVIPLSLTWQNRIPMLPHLNILPRSLLPNSLPKLLFKWLPSIPIHSYKYMPSNFTWSSFKYSAWHDRFLDLDRRTDDPLVAFLSFFPGFVSFLVDMTHLCCICSDIFLPYPRVSFSVVFIIHCTVYSIHPSIIIQPKSPH